jgi:citrate synthase
MAMEQLKEKFEQKVAAYASEVKDILRQYGADKFGDYTIDDIYGGMKGITGLVTETSLLDANEGIRFRGYSIPELCEKLPGNGTPYPEGLFYLMLFNELPTLEDTRLINKSWTERWEIPQHVYQTIDALPKSTHPMTQFSIGIMAMQTESVFAKAYHDGINKKDHWKYVFEDTMNLIARLPHVASYIYRRVFKDGKRIEADTKLDWAGNFAHMLGFDNEEFMKLMRLYMTIHADHEGGNVSAHTTHLVGSALSEPYLSFAASMNGLAGPLHGLANQEVIRWLEKMRTQLGVKLPTKEQIATYVRSTLAAGQVVPGYGHAVLRKTDPRFTAQMEFAKKYFPDDELVNTVWRVYETVPPILESLGKVKNPWPNVDAHSGALLTHYGLVEQDFYTVLFGVARSLGVLTSLIWDRALALPLERPKSITTEALKKKLGLKAS